MADKGLRERISDALDQALQDEIAGALTILWRKISGEESPDQAMVEFRTAISGIKAVHQQAELIIKETWE